VAADPAPDDTGRARPARRGRRTGEVREFDDPRGVGTVEDDAGERFPFHCTAIADGSRTIEAGTRVGFVVRPGHVGRLEASAVTPLA